MKSLGYDLEKYLDQGGKDLDIVQKYFFDEKNIKNIRATRTNIIHMLKKGTLFKTEFCQQLKVLGFYSYLSI